MNHSNKTIVEKINTQSAELFAEFRQHVQDVQQAQPDATDKSIIFEGWILQKIAGLQLLVIELSERIAVLENRGQ